MSASVHSLACVQLIRDRNLSQVDRVDHVDLSFLSGSVSRLETIYVERLAHMPLVETKNVVTVIYVKQQVESHLRESNDISEKYQALKTYLMLSDADKRDPVFLNYWLNKNLNSNQFFSANEFVQVLAHANNLVKNNMSFDGINQPLVDDSRRILQSQTVSDIYYQQFKIAYFNTNDEMLSMAQLAGSDWRTVFTTSKDDIQTISPLYTPDVFSSVLSEKIDDYLDQLETETWILGEGNVINKGALADELEMSYARDYVNNWQELLQSVSVKTTTSMATLDAALKLTIGLNSPIFLLLDSVVQATKLVEVTPKSQLANLSSTASRAAYRVERINSLRSTDTPDYLVTSQFTQLHELMAGEQKTVVQQRMSSIVSDISVALNFDSRNEQISANDNVLKPLEAFAFSQPTPLNRWGSELATSINAMRNQAQRIKISNLWQQDVLAQCRDITRSKYPFDLSSQSDVSLRDLSQLFGNSGVIYQFYEEHIQPLIRGNSYPLQWKPNVARTYGFDSKVLPFFEAVNKVRDSLYVVDGDRAQLNLAFKPMYLDSRLAKFKMSIHGQSFSYQFGRPTSTTITWPPQDFSSNSLFAFERRDGSDVLQSEGGLFALFRLIEGAKVKQINENKIEVTFSKNNYEAIYEISGSGRTNPMVFNQLSRFQCLSEF